MLIQKVGIKNLEIVRGRMMEDLSVSISQQQLAKDIHVSLKSLRAAFKAYYGVSIHTYIRQQRMERAKQLLITEPFSVKEIATSVGYKRKSFTDAFTRATGHSPYLYRKLFFISMECMKQDDQHQKKEKQPRKQDK